MTVTTQTQEYTDERKQFLWSVFVTALEGGIDYWSRCESYRWSNGDNKTGDYDTFRAVIMVPDRNADERVINIDTIAKGVDAIAKARKPYYDPNGAKTQCKSVKFLTQYVANTVRNASHDNEGGDIDASLADAIVQVGLFSEVTYG